MSAMIGNPFFIDVSRGGRLVGEGYGAPFGLAFSRPSLATFTDTLGRLTFCPNNLLLNTETLATQSVTLAAGNYILSIKGTGSVTLSGSASGTLAGTGASNRVSLAFSVSTSGSVTFTKTGTVTNARLSRVTFETSFRSMDDVETTGSAYYGPRFGTRNSGGVPGLIIEPSQTNLIRNNIMLGVAAGTPGTMPTNWGVANQSGLSTSVVGGGTEDGYPYVDIRMFGTTSVSNAYIRLVFETSTGIALTQPATGMLSGFAKIVSGAMPGDGYWQTYVANFQSDGATQVQPISAGPITVGATRSYYATSITYGASQAGMAYTRPALNAVFPTSGTVVDVTVRVYPPQFVIDTVDSSIILTSGSAVTRSADALSFNVPSTVPTLRYTFDNKTTQDVAVSAGAYTVPTNLNRVRLRHIKRAS